jgi:GH15 family glucan-1,4-alpha-glucosidase
MTPPRSKAAEAKAEREPPDYLPIAEHGIIGDLHSIALVGSDGTIDWYCPGRFDAPSVFASILDRHKGGYFRISPSCAEWSTKQLYIPDTNVLVTRFFTPGGVTEIRDFMPIEGKRLGMHRHRLVRRVVQVRGAARFSIEIEPRFDYGRAGHETRIDARGVHFRSGDLSLLLQGSPRFKRTKLGAYAEVELTAGQSETFVLEQARHDEAPRQYSEEETQKSFEDTIEYWRRWLSHSRYEGRWREVVHRSALALKLLTYEPTGAIVAAPTTSIPEHIGGPRNWDYRYTWIRDAAFSLYALLRLGFSEEAGAFMGWLVDRFSKEDGKSSGPLQTMYTIDGRCDLPEQTLDHLEGYMGSSPVRIGNAAFNQHQLDIYGELVDSVYLYNKHATPISNEAWSDLQRIVDWVCENWNQVDEGIWETRGGAKDFTYSRLMSWVAIERAMRMSTQRGLPSNFEAWRSERDRIYRQILERGWNGERRAFVQHYDCDVLDASLLMMPLVKFMSPTDPRWLSTLDAISETLVSDSLVYRYDPAVSPDGLAGSEGTFSICSFWYVECLARAGRLSEAQLAFEKMLTYANHLALFSEQIGPRGELLGNFPQALTHLGLISAAVNLDRQLEHPPASARGAW